MTLPRETFGVPDDGACLYCRAVLDRNDLLETFPYGRRLAYDAARRLLWVVCSACWRWSSSVTYALPEIFEECERHQRAASRRLSSENVSLARHTSGVELIRVGRATPAELAAWRYGDMLTPARRCGVSFLIGGPAEEWLAGRRDRLRGTLTAAPYLLGGLVLGVISDTAFAQASALGLMLLAFFKMFTVDSAEHEKQLERLATRSRVVLGRFDEVGGGSFLLHADQAWRSRLVSGQEPEQWRLSVPARQRGGAHEIEGREAVHALRLALTEASRGTVGAAGPAAVRSATAAIESAGGAGAFLAWAPVETTRRGLRYATLGELPRLLRLSLEIAVDEVHESALEDGPRLLEQEWREAETLAAPAVARDR